MAEYFRHRQTGERGYLVQRDGEVMIKMDTGPQGAEKRFVRHFWVPDAEHRPLTRTEIGRVLYESDIAVCRMLHIEQGRRRPEWGLLSHDKQQKWALEGPKEPRRRAAWAALLEVFLPYTE